MIVIAIIGILIAVGVTGWKAAVRATNEAAAIKTLRSIAEQQMLYYNAHQRSTFGTFDEMLKENLLDTRFAGTTPVVDGYVYQMKVIPKSTSQPASYSINADPQVSEGVGATGKTITIWTPTRTPFTSTRRSRPRLPIHLSAAKHQEAGAGAVAGRGRAVGTYPN